MRRGALNTFHTMQMHAEHWSKVIQCCMVEVERAGSLFAKLDEQKKELDDDNHEAEAKELQNLLFSDPRIPPFFRSIVEMLKVVAMIRFVAKEASIESLDDKMEELSKGWALISDRLSHDVPASMAGISEDNPLPPNGDAVTPPEAKTMLGELEAGRNVDTLGDTSTWCTLSLLPVRPATDLVSFGGCTYHPRCGNLWLNCVSQDPPIANDSVMDLF